MYIFDTFDLSFFSILVQSQKLHSNLSKFHFESKLKEIWLARFAEGFAFICNALFSEIPFHTSTVVLAIALFLSPFATACTVNSHAWLNVWDTFFHTATLPSENFHCISHNTFHLVTTSNSAFAGATSSSLFTFIYIHKLFKAHSHASPIQFQFESFWFLFFTKGQLSVFVFHFHTTICPKSSTIHTGFFTQSQSMSLSHTSPILSKSVSVWLGL